MSKAQLTRGLSSAYQSNFCRFYHNFFTQILIKFYLQNLNQASTSKSQPNISILTLNLNFKILTKPSFRILTKIKLHNLYKLLPTRSSASTSATVRTSTSFELQSSHARVTSIKFTKQVRVRESVSDWQALPRRSNKNCNRLWHGDMPNQLVQEYAKDIPLWKYFFRGIFEKRHFFSNLTRTMKACSCVAVCF